MKSDFEYIQLLEKADITPNFYVSDEYFQKSGFQEKRFTGKDGNWVYIQDEDWLVFPPITDTGQIMKDMVYARSISGCRGVWSDFPGYDAVGAKPELLDHEYIYDPKSFLSLKGIKWEVFRKNVRKFPARYGHKLNYRPVEPMDFIIQGHVFKLLPLDREWLNVQLDEVLLKWLVGMPEDATIHDDFTIQVYLRAGKRRDILMDDQGLILGVNIWDENYKFINYRYCFCRRIPFLSEYMRYLFYTNPIIIVRNKLVCDGGDLLESNLCRFKTKLNPVSVREVYSWESI